MAGLRDIYGAGVLANAGVASHADRLLSAKSGSLNTTMNMLPRSGYAEPLVAAMAGSQAAGLADESQAANKTSQFLDTFSRLAKVSKGAALKFFNEAGPEVGITAPADGVDVQPDITSVHFENGHVLGAGPSGVFRPDDTGEGWIPVDQEYMDQFKKDAEKFNAQKTAKKTTGAGGQDKKSTLINSYRGIKTAQANMKANMGTMAATRSPEYQKLEQQAAGMERDYPWLLQEAAAPTPAPAPAGGGIKIDPSKLQSGW